MNLFSRLMAQYMLNGMMWCHYVIYIFTQNFSVSVSDRGVMVKLLDSGILVRIPLILLDPLSNIYPRGKGMNYSILPSWG